MNYQLFAVRNLDATTTKHAGKIDRLHELMEAQNLQYSDILDSDAWQTIETMTENKLRLYEALDITNKPRQIARLINEYTRSVIQNTLVFFDIPKSCDTAFFIANYQKTIEGMDDILENVLARRKTV